MDEILKSLNISSNLNEAANQATARLEAQQARVDRLEPTDKNRSIEYSILRVLQRIADHANDELAKAAIESKK